MEIADVFVVNKSDRPGADKLKQEIEVMLGIRRGNAFRHVGAHHRPAEGGNVRRLDGKGPRSIQPSEPWEPPVVGTVAVTGAGVDELVAALDAHHAWLAASGALAARRRERLVARTRVVVERALRRWAWDEMGAAELVAARLDDVASGRRSPYDVAAEVMSHVKTGASR
jgi:LAO/AO transport system kinase